MVKKLLLLIAMLLMLFYFNNVNADTYNPYGLAFSNINNFGYSKTKLPYNWSINSYSDGRIPIFVFSDVNTDINNQSYIRLYLCSTDQGASFSITNSSYDDYYIDDKNVYTLNTGKTRNHNGNTCYEKIVYLNVGKWGIPPNGADMYVTNSGLYMYNGSSSTAYNSLYDVQISDEDTFLNDYFYYSSISNQTLIINQNGQIINGQNITNEKLDNIDDTLNNSNIDNPNFEDFEQYISENGVITQLITLPVRLYTQILNSINSNCTPFVLGELFGHNLVMNCINPSNFFGSVLWNTIDILGTGLFIYVISKKMILVFHKFTNLEEGDILD